jgi:hypothetical protein
MLRYISPAEQSRLCKPSIPTLRDMKARSNDLPAKWETTQHEPLGMDSPGRKRSC